LRELHLRFRHGQLNPLRIESPVDMAGRASSQ
jgi:hypothetical protein